MSKLKIMISGRLNGEYLMGYKG